jgi:hypothetical protein
MEQVTMCDIAVAQYPSLPEAKSLASVMRRAQRRSSDPLALMFHAISDGSGLPSWSWRRTMGAWLLYSPSPEAVNEKPASRCVGLALGRSRPRPTLRNYDELRTIFKNLFVTDPR